MRAVEVTSCTTRFYTVATACNHAITNAKLMLRILLPALLLLMAQTAAARTVVNHLDKSSPAITLDTAGGTVVYGDSVYTLDDRTFYLDASLTAADISSSSCLFADVAEAFKAVNRAASGGRPVTLLIAPWVYWLDDPDDPAVRRDPSHSNAIPYAVRLNVGELKMVGLTDNPENVVFAVNRGQTQGAMGNFTMFHFKGEALTLRNITFGNYCNVDLEYPLDRSLDRKRRRDAIVQAQIGICDATDRLFAENCRFISRLNLCPFVGARRSLYYDCYFECTDDALSGSAVYLDCRFTFFSSKPFYSTAETGAVFLNCDITSRVDGTQYFTKVPGMVTLIDTRINSLPENAGRFDLRWTRDESPVVCYQSGVRINGEEMWVDATRPALSVDLTDRPLLDAYKIMTPDGDIVYNTANLLAGDDGWDPLGAGPLVGDATNIPVGLRFNRSKVSLSADGDTVTLRPEPLRWGSYPVNYSRFGKLDWKYPMAVTISPDSDGGALCTSANTLPRKVDGFVTLKTSSGLAGSVSVSVDPLLKEAPALASGPTLAVGKGEVVLSYRLPSVDEDRSHIEWYRYRRPDATDTIPVSHGYIPGACRYKLSAADKDHYIMAKITPSGADTRPGEPVTVSLAEPISRKQMGLLVKDERLLVTDFSDVPVRYQPVIGKGLWTFDAFKPADTAPHDWTPDPQRGWYYGKATDAAPGTGLVQWTRGARMFYTPDRSKCREMTLDLTLQPCKSAGQGFGSATGQYMDIYIKFDPVTMTGYALRIERVPDYDHAVAFTLMRYDNGAPRAISDTVISSCYRTDCHLTLSLEKGVLTARATTTAPAAKSASPQVRPDLFLTARVDDANDAATAFGIQHTGSTGASATLISRLEAAWK